VAKHLWRDDLIPMKYNLDFAMKFHLLRQMLEWRMEMDHGWSIKTGAYGKGLKKRLPREIWSELEGTYAGAGREENWQSLFQTLAFFGKIARQVGDHLGYAYPEDRHQRVLAYLRKVKDLPKDAQSFD
jgi:aminoglycoside 6-adenylyltransferase